MRNRKPLLLGLAVAGLAVIVLVALVLPKRSEVHAHAQKLVTAQQQGQALQAQIDALKQAKLDAPKTRRSLAGVEQQLPSTASLPSLLRLIRRAADTAAVDFVQISPGAPATGTTTGAYSTIPTQITTAGSYFSVEEFLYRLETLRRAVKVTNLTLGAGPHGLPQLEAQLTADVFTTDTSVGPGSIPGPTTSTGGA